MKNREFFDKIKILKQKTREQLLKMDLSDDFRKMCVKDPEYFSKYLIAQDILLKQGIKAWIKG